MNAARASPTAPPETGQRRGLANALGLHQWALHLMLLVALALSMVLFDLGGADWADSLEAEGPQIVQEMLRGSGWVLPLQNGRHLPFKPPLCYWLGALSAAVRHTGVDLFDPRLPSAVLGTLCVVLVYLFARRHADEAVALWAGLILLTTPQFVIEARNSRVDMAFCCFLTAGLLLAHRVWEGHGTRGTAVGAGLCTALAILSKGPLALVLVVLVLGATALLAPPKPGWRALLSPATLAAVLVAPIGWYAAATWQHGLPFLRLQLYGENVGRLLGEEGYDSFFYYVGPLITDGLPWIVLLPLAAAGPSRLAPRARRFLWAWSMAMLLFFTLSPGKRQAYLLPLRPALAMLLAGWLAPQLARLRAHRRSVGIPRAAHVAVGVLALGGIGTILGLRMGVGGYGASQADWGYWWRTYFDAHVGTALAFVLGIGVGIEVIVAGLFQRRFELAAAALAGTMAWALAIGVAAAVVVRGEGASEAPLARRILEELRPDEPLAFFGTEDREYLPLVFYLRRQVPVVAEESEVAPCRPPRGGMYLIPETHWAERSCFHLAEWTEVLRGGGAVDGARHHWLVVARYTGPVSETAPRSSDREADEHRSEHSAPHGSSHWTFPFFDGEEELNETELTIAPELWNPQVLPPIHPPPAVRRQREQRRAGPEGTGSCCRSG